MVGICGHLCDQYACHTNVRCNPKSNLCLASTEIFTKGGFSISGDDDQGIILLKITVIIEFDNKIQALDGVISVF